MRRRPALHCTAALFVPLHRAVLLAWPHGCTGSDGTWQHVPRVELDGCEEDLHVDLRPYRVLARIHELVGDPVETGRALVQGAAVDFFYFARQRLVLAAGRPVSRRGERA